MIALRTLGATVALLLSSAAPRALDAHGIHISYGRMNLAGDRVTGTVTFYRDDFERSLAAYVGSDLRSLTRQRIDAATREYVLSRLQLLARGSRAIPMTLLVRGGDRGAIWFEFAFAVSRRAGDLSFANRALFELFDDQMHLLSVMTPDGERSVALTIDEPSTGISH